MLGVFLCENRVKNMLTGKKYYLLAKNKIVKLLIYKCLAKKQKKYLNV
jgi:hypothetical protein